MVKVDELIDGAREAITVKRVYGEPIVQNGVTIIPAANVRGGGGGGGDVEGTGGSGFGLTAAPVGAYVIRGDEVSWEPASNPNRRVLGWQLVAALALFVWWRVGRNR